MRALRHCLQFMLLTILIPASAGAEEDYLSISFSKKNQVRTAMIWIQFKSHLIMNQTSRRSAKLPKGSKARVVADQLTRKDPAFSRVGKLFFTQDYGQVAQCSASLVGESGLIATAAHCVMAVNGDWNSDFMFVRGYGSSDQDVFAIDCIALRSAWGENSDEEILEADYAFLQSSRENTFGGLQVNTTGVVPSNLRIVGYSEEHSEGRQMLELPVQVFSEPGKLGALGNDFGKGNSGAPWISLEKPELFSVSSHFVKDDKNIMWGPRFDETTQGLMEFTGRGCRYQ